MDPYTAIRQRYGLELPELYRTMQAQGHFDPGGERCLWLTDVEWLSLRDVVGYQFAKWQTLALKGLFVPFTLSARRDEWCWRPDWAPPGGEPPVVFCERGPGGYGYAPDFGGFLFRALLEELSGSWLIDGEGDEAGKEQVRRSVEIVVPYLPARWGEKLRELVLQDWYTDQDGTVCVYPRSQCEEIVAAELAFPRLNEEFIQDGGP